MSKIYLSKRLFYALILVTIIAFVSVILGLYFGLTQDPSKSKKLETCSKLACDDFNVFFNELNKKCPSQIEYLSQTTSRPTQATTQSPVKLNYRLPGDLIPNHYDIMLDVQFTNQTANNKSFPYNGFVKINFTCIKETNQLVFHMNQINITRITLKGINDTSFGNDLTDFNWSFEDERQFFQASLPRILQKGYSYSVLIDYIGYLQDDNVGFYRSSYVTKDGIRRWLMTSQMEPTDARKAFPCFDEPALKATFSVTVLHPSNYHAISNMPIENTVTTGLVTKTVFQKTPIMSTYLVGLVVSDFQCKNSTAYAPEKVDVRVCAKPEAYDQLDYSLDVGRRVIEFFNKLLDVEYPLPKCDHLAIPDFAAGAMENWAIITYRESRLLVNKDTSQSAEQSIATVIAHELAHMWFGDLVSPEWWNDLFLNEGFARYMEHIGTDHAKPDWKLYEQMVNLVFTIMQVDAVPSAHPIQTDVSTPGEINEIFDDITYGKGGSVLRMVHYILGNSTFYRGLKQYLNENKYGNARENFLWKTLGEVAQSDGKLNGLNFTLIMNTWIRQMGHPIVNIKRINNTAISLTQKQFLLDPTQQSEPSPYGYKWWIPFTYSIESSGSYNPSIFSLNLENLYNRIEWFRPDEDVKIITLQQPLNQQNFIIANLDVSGFYRVNYEDDNWDAIIRQLSQNKDLIPTRNRAQFINDAFGSAQAGLLGATKPFELIGFLSNELEWLPWRVTLNRLQFYINLLDLTGSYGYLEKYLTQLIQPIYTKLTWEEKPSDSWLERLIRTSVIQFACQRNLPDCVSRAVKYFSDWMTNPSVNNIPSSYRSLVYCTAIKAGSLKEFEFASEQYDRETDANRRNELQSGMSCTTEAWIIKRFLEDQINEKKVRPQDTLSGLRSAATKSNANAITWNFVKENWNLLYERFGTGLSFARLVADIASKFNTQTQLDDFSDFFNRTQNQGSATREVKISSDKIKANIKWMTSNYELLSKWLQENIKP